MQLDATYTYLSFNIVTYLLSIKHTNVRSYLPSILAYLIQKGIRPRHLNKTGKLDRGFFNIWKVTDNTKSKREKKLFVFNIISVIN